MDEKDDTFVERFADTLSQSGWPRMSARIFAALMATPTGARTAAELSAQLGVGPSAISNGAKMLRSLSLVDVTRQGDRQIVYAVRPDAWMEAVASRDAELRALESILTDGAQITTDPRASARLVETADFFAFLRSQLPALVQQWRAMR